MPLTRRGFVTATTAATCSGLRAFSAARISMGVAATCYLTAWRPKDTLEFIDHCQSLGAGGAQAPLSSLDPAYLRQIRERVERYGMFLEFFAPMPGSDPAEFEAILKASKVAGARCVRAACLGGRRYENFSTIEAWTRFAAESKASIERAAKIVERHQFHLAVENHKDWTVDEFAQILKRYSSEYLGVCLDTGNNISLLDDPYEVVETLAPYAISTHVKDMGVMPYKEGFLLSEVPLGEGYLDMKRIVATIRKARPSTPLVLEMITRNPLQVPSLTEKYWATFPGREGKCLARALRAVERHWSHKPLPRIEGLDLDAQKQLENLNVKISLAYAREQLGLV